jgi:hypothetical protein
LNSKQDSLGFLLASVARQLRHAFQQRLTDPQLTLAQARALVYVARHEGVRQVELAALLEVQPITLARLIDQLARAGLVERRADRATAAPTASTCAPPPARSWTPSSAPAPPCRPTPCAAWRPRRSSWSSMPCTACATTWARHRLAAARNP